MIKLSWNFNGCTVPGNRIADELTKAVRAKAGEAAKDSIARVRCPAHGTPPRNIHVSGNGSSFRFQYDTCCERLQQAVNSRFR